MPYIPTAVVNEGGSGSLSQSYLGYNTVGGSVETMTSLRVYAKKITLTADGLLASVDCHIRGSAADLGSSQAAGVFSDSGGSPDLVLAFVGYDHDAVSVYLRKSIGAAGTFRWFCTPIGIWLPAGDYWIFIHNRNGGNDLHYDSGGSDRYMTEGAGLGITDWDGLYSPTTSSNTYSIRANVLS